MRVAQQFAGYCSAAGRQPPQGAWARSRARSCAKEKRGVRRGRAGHRLRRRARRQLFAIIEQFADYAFNKSHSFGYGFIAYQTAYLKAHYPVEYLARLLTQREGQRWTRRPSTSPSAGRWASRCSVPDVNRSASDLRGVTRRSPTASEPARSPSGSSGRRATSASRPRRLAAGRARRQRALRRLLRLRRAGRLPGAQQEDARVADQGGRLRLHGPPRQGLLRAFERIVDGTMLAPPRARRWA